LKEEDGHDVIIVTDKVALRVMSRKKNKGRVGKGDGKPNVHGCTNGQKTANVKIFESGVLGNKKKPVKDESEMRKRCQRE